MIHDKALLTGTACTSVVAANTILKVVELIVEYHMFSIEVLFLVRRHRKEVADRFDKSSACTTGI